MLTVYKYLLEPVILMPRGARLLSVQVQREEVVLWALVDPSERQVLRHVKILGTGHDAPRLVNFDTPFVGTFQIADGLVFHVFDLGESEA